MASNRIRRHGTSFYSAQLPTKSSWCAGSHRPDTSCCRWWLLILVSPGTGRGLFIIPDKVRANEGSRVLLVLAFHLAVELLLCRVDVMRTFFLRYSHYGFSPSG